MTIEIFVLWYITLVYYFLWIVDTRSEKIALVVIVLLGPLCFPISIIGRIYIKEREKWRVNAWYRDNWPPKEYEIVRDKTP